MKTSTKQLTEDSYAYEEVTDALHETIQEHLDTPSEDGFDVVTDTFKHYIEECSEEAIMVSKELDIEKLLIEGINQVHNSIGQIISDASGNAAGDVIRRKLFKLNNA